MTQETGGTPVSCVIFSKEIFTKIAGKKPRGKLAKRQLHPMTDAVFRYWTARGLTPVAAQVPVQLPELNIMTQADVIVEDRQGQLWMHEIKTGYCGMRGAQGKFAAQFSNVPCTKGNQWDMQRHFTEVRSKCNRDVSCGPRAARIPRARAF